MKKVIPLLLVATIMLAGCNELSRMASKSNKIRYQANPNPVETRGDNVIVNFTGAIPPKYFGKSVAVFMQPVFIWNNDTIPLTPFTLKGESVKGECQTINHATGGRFTYTDEFPFREGTGMESGRVILTPRGYRCKEIDDAANFEDELIANNPAVDFATALISDGVNNTASWVNIRGNISISPINYNKKQGVVETADIYFPNGTSKLDWSFSMNQRFDTKAGLENLKRIMLENGLPKQINITGWASPEGEETNNAGVSKNRADIATEQLHKVLDEVLTIMAKRAHISPQDVEYYKYTQMKQIVITTRPSGEDWVHFVIMVEQSNIQDKHAIINVVETQQNLIKREQMIRNMSEVYSELNTDIFPNLRRAQIALYYSEARRTDQELAKQATLNPAKLSFDELMYAAYINYSYPTKLKYYKWATENHPQEWAAWNNAGAVAFYLADYAEAERYLNVARELNPHNPDILNNTGLLCLAKGDYTLAKYYFEEAQNQGSYDADANLPILNLKRGNYEEAMKQLKENTCSFNLAFAQLMNGQTNACIRTLDCCLDQTAEVNYLRAVAYARLDDRNNTFKNLKASVDMNYDYKAKAAIDIEFKQFRSDDEFQQIVKLYR